MDRVNGKSKPLVTVVMVVFNQNSYLAEALESVSKQISEEVSIELLVRDDGSSDGSGDTLIAFAKDATFPVRIFLGEHEGVRGIAPALNFLISLANGDFVAFLAGDDVLLPGGVKTMVQDFRNDQSLSIVVADGWDGPDLISPVRLHRGLDLRALRSRNPYALKRHVRRNAPRIFLQATMARRGFLHSFTVFDEALIADDWVFWVRSADQMICLKTGFSYNATPVCFRRRVAGSASSDVLVHFERIREVAAKYSMREQEIIDDFIVGRWLKIWFRKEDHSKVGIAVQQQAPGAVRVSKSILRLSKSILLRKFTSPLKPVQESF